MFECGKPAKTMEDCVSTLTEPNKWINKRVATTNSISEKVLYRTAQTCIFVFAGVFAIASAIEGSIRILNGLLSGTVKLYFLSPSGMGAPSVSLPEVVSRIWPTIIVAAIAFVALTAWWWTAYYVCYKADQNEMTFTKRY